MSKPDAVFNEPLATGWLRTELYGDEDRAGAFVLAARAQLGAMRTMYGVNQRIADGEPGGFYHATQTLPDGTVIQTITNDGHDLIRIHASSQAQPTKPPLPREEPLFLLGVAGVSRGPTDIIPFRYLDGAGFDFPEFAADHYYGRATGISWNGDIVCGSMGGDSGDQAFTWTKPDPVTGEGGTVLLSQLDPQDHPDSVDSFATAIAGDGRTVVGYSRGWPCRWDDKGVIRQLFTPLSDRGFVSGGQATCVSGDGSVIGGFFSKPNGYGNATLCGALWNADGGMTTELPLPGTFTMHTATLAFKQVVTAPGATTETFFYPGNLLHTPYRITDGAEIADDTYSEYEPGYPWVVTDSYTITTYPTSNETRVTTFHNIEYHVAHGLQVYGMSFDGTYVVGAHDEPPQAFRWSAEGGMEILGTLPGDTYAVATGVCADGSMVTGYSVGPTGSRWFVWLEEPALDTDGSVITPAGMSDMTTGAGNAIAQGGDLCAGRDSPFPLDTTRMAVLRSIPAKTLITETRLGDMPGEDGNPALSTPCEALAITSLMYTVHANGAVDTFPAFPGLAVSLDENSLLVFESLDPAAP